MRGAPRTTSLLFRVENVTDSSDWAEVWMNIVATAGVGLTPNNDRTVPVNNAVAGVDSNQLRVIVKNAFGTPMGTGVVRYGATPSINLGSGFGLQNNCTSHDCTVNATSTANGNFATTASFTDMRGNTYTLGPIAYTFQGIVGTYWDTVPSNSVVDGGAGIWSTDTTSPNWTNALGVNVGPWDNGKTATFKGTASTVTVDNAAGQVDIAGLKFETGGYTITGGALRLVTNGINTVTVDAGLSATVASPVTAVNGGYTLNKMGAGTLFLNGDVTGPTIRIGDGKLSIGGGARLDNGDHNYPIVVGGTFEYASSANQILRKDISGNGGALIKSGAGTLTLLAVNGYTGATAVSAGTLLVNGSTAAASALTVAPGATLGGAGTVAGAVAVSGTLAPGASGSAGVLSTGALTLNAGSTLTYQLGASGNDQVDVTGNLALNGTLNVTANGTFGPGTYRLFNYSGTLGGSLAIGTLPPGVTAANARIDTSVAGQVNLVINGRTYWDAVSPDNGAVNGGTGAWSTSATSTNWTFADGSSNGPWQNGEVATFKGTGGTVTVDNAAGQVNVSGLTFESNPTVTGGALTLVGTDNLVRGGGTISAPLAGGSGNTLHKQGAGRLTLSGVNTFTGGMTISDDILELHTPLGGGNYGGAIAINASGSLIYFLAPAQTLSGPISGQGFLRTVVSDLTLTGTNTHTGNMRVGRMLTVGGGGVLGGGNYGGNLSLDNGSTLNYASTANQTLTNATTGANETTLVQSGPGTLTLAGTSNLNGVATVAAATLLVNGAATLNATTSVAAGATLGGTGTVARDVAVSGTLAPGAGGAGTLTTGKLTLNGGSFSVFELGQAGTAGGALNDLLAVNGDLALNGTLNVSKTTGGTFGDGTYRLFTYTGTLSGALAIGTLPAGVPVANAWIDTSTPGQVNLVIAPPAPPGTYWDATSPGNGAVNGGAGTWSAAAGSSNWTDATGAANGPWDDGKVATFKGTAGAVTVDNTAGAVNIGGLSFETDGYRVQSGTLTATDASNALTVTTGKVQLQSVLAGGAGSALVKQGVGALALQGANTYSGGTTIAAGTLLLGDQGGVGTLGTGTVTLAGGALGVSPGSSGATYTFANPFSVTADGTIGSDDGVTKLTGSIALATGKTLTVGGSGWDTKWLHLDGVISGAGALRIQPNGLIMNGGGSSTNGKVFLNGANTYTGATTIVNGTTVLAGTLGSGSYAGAIANSGTLDYASGSAQTLSGVLSGTGALIKSGTGTLTLTGANSYTGATTIGTGTLTVSGNGMLGASTYAGAIANAGTLNYQSNATQTFSGVLSGTGALTKAGTGVLTLSGANSYTGTTTVSAGTLLANGAATGASAVAVTSGAALGGNGKLPGTVAVSGTLAPGASGAAGVLSTGALTLNAGSTLAWQLGASGSDRVDVTGNLTLNGTLNVTANGTFGPGTYRLFNYTGTRSGTLTLGTLPAGVPAGNAWIDTSVAGQVNLVITLPALAGRVFLDSGKGGGTANNGIVDGGELGRSGITVRVDNCASTIIGTTVTDGSGAWSVDLEAGASGTICVTAGLPDGTRATGANAGGTVLPNGSATSVGGTNYTFTRATQRIAFTLPTGTVPGLNFGQVRDNTFAAGGTKNGMPGSAVVYAHTFMANSAGQVTFTVAATALPALAGWAETVYRDPGCQGVLNASSIALSGAISVAEGERVCLLLKQFIPAQALSGNRNTATLTANFVWSNASPTLSASYTVDDVSTVSMTALHLDKAVRNITTGVAFGANNAAKPGDRLEYRVTYTNNSASPISNLVVNDTIPAYTKFVSATVGSTPTALTSCKKNTPANPAPAVGIDCSAVQTAGGTGGVAWTFSGSLPPGASGTVLFSVDVD